ncbi:MAG: hypothetical protein JSW06_06645 [Thermoplasmatales archaeon]|nr:MAG: hypothetical protein JSW06_06645 [Thermoplasmatales archaeon]
MNQKGFEIKKNTKTPFIGFFPCFYSMGETIPLIKIAKSYMDLGGKAVFFSHRGEYEYLAEDIGCRVVRLNDILEGLSDEGKEMFKGGASLTKTIIKIYSKKNTEKLVSEEINAFTNAGIDLIVSSFNLTCSISSRATNIPSVVIASGTTIPPYYESGLLTFPDGMENFFTKRIPSTLKNEFAKWLLLKNKMLVRTFNKVAKKYQVQPFKYFNDIVLGDHTFVCDDIKFLGINPSEQFPIENFIGPIIGGDLFQGQKKKIDPDIENHLKQPGKSIVILMGSTGVKDLFLKIVETLNQTNYNVIAVYTNLLDKDSLPKTNENILLKEYVPFYEVSKLVDLAIIHGGRGTIYELAYSGKPAICIPLFLEHQGNIDNLVRNNSAIKLSEKFFKPEKLLEFVNEIFTNYDTYLNNAQNLAKKLQKESGEKKAVKRLVEISQLKHVE